MPGGISAYHSRVLGGGAVSAYRTQDFERVRRRTCILDFPGEFYLAAVGSDMSLTATSNRVFFSRTYNDRADWALGLGFQMRSTAWTAGATSNIKAGVFNTNLSHAWNKVGSYIAGSECENTGTKTAQRFHELLFAAPVWIPQGHLTVVSKVNGASVGNFFGVYPRIQETDYALDGLIPGPYQLASGYTYADPIDNTDWSAVADGSFSLDTNTVPCMIWYFLWE